MSIETLREGLEKYHKDMEEALAEKAKEKAFNEIADACADGDYATAEKLRKENAEKFDKEDLEYRAVSDEEINNTLADMLSKEAEKSEDVQVLREIQETGEAVPERTVNTTAIVEDQSDITYQPLPIDPEDLKTISELNKRIKAGEKFPIYNSLPPKVKDMILKEARKIGIEYNDKAGLNTISKIFIESFVSEAALDDAFAQLQKDLSEAFNGKDIVESLLESRKEQFEDKFQEMANKMREVDPTHAAKLDSMVNAFKDAYTYNNLVEHFKSLNNPTQLKLREGGKLLKRINRVYEDIDYELSTSGLTMDKIAEMEHLMVLKLLIEPAEVQRFIYLVKDYADKKYPGEDPGRIIYLFYSFDILRSICRIDPRHPSTEFAKDVIDNLRDALDALSDLSK